MIRHTYLDVSFADGVVPPTVTRPIASASSDDTVSSHDALAIRHARVLLSIVREPVDSNCTRLPPYGTIPFQLVQYG